ncbi:MAG: hypothetical protein AAFN18_13585 [Cyanobacteria bacterium J06554_6]
MTISVASLHSHWDRHRDKPKHLFMLVIPEDDVRPYVSVAYFPGGWLVARLMSLPIVTYEGKSYIPLTMVEKSRRKIFYSIWLHFHGITGKQPELMVCPIPT